MLILGRETLPRDASRFNLWGVGWAAYGCYFFIPGRGNVRRKRRCDDEAIYIYIKWNEEKNTRNNEKIKARKYNPILVYRPVFGDDLEQLLCKWHIHRAWRQKINLIPEKYQSEIYQTLMVLLNETDRTEFEKTIHDFFLRYSNVAKEFANYFEKNYARRAEKWAMCYQNFEYSGTNTNMHMESFHNNLKTYYMGRKPNKRINNLINLLLTVKDDSYWRHRMERTYYV